MTVGQCPTIPSFTFKETDGNRKGNNHCKRCLKPLEKGLMGLAEHGAFISAIPSDCSRVVGKTWPRERFINYTSARDVFKESSESETWCLLFYALFGLNRSLKLRDETKAAEIVFGLCSVVRNQWSVFGDAASLLLHLSHPKIKNNLEKEKNRTWHWREKKEIS